MQPTIKLMPVYDFSLPVFSPLHSLGWFRPLVGWLGGAADDEQNPVATASMPGPSLSLFTVWLD
jgi:hypothetical protein